jgi:hypothetical protein
VARRGKKVDAWALLGLEVLQPRLLDESIAKLGAASRTRVMTGQDVGFAGPAISFAPASPGRVVPPI